jgi:hypothetical protein
MRWKKIPFVYFRKTWFKFYQNSDPDPHSSKMLDPDPYPDPHIINAGPKHCTPPNTSYPSRYFVLLIQKQNLAARLRNGLT